MPSEELKVLKTYRDRQIAEIEKSVLTANGIDARLFGTDVKELHLLASGGDIRLLVPEDRIKEAMELLSGDHSSAADTEYENVSAEQDLNNEKAQTAADWKWYATRALPFVLLILYILFLR